jgi:conjugative relaxase-like TrwC/TraI family protein
VHGFDLTFCAPKSVSLVRALRTDGVLAKAIADAHTTALSEAMKYLAAHAGYTRVHNPHTRRKRPRAPGLVAIAYQHETSRRSRRRARHAARKQPARGAIVSGDRRQRRAPDDRSWHRCDDGI